MKTATASTYIQCNVDCPYCGHYQDKLEDLRDYFEDGRPSADECEAEIRCNKCDQLFIVDAIRY